MTHGGGKLGGDSIFGSALTEYGESLRQMAAVKVALEDDVERNFLDPLADSESDDLKEIARRQITLSGT